MDICYKTLSTLTRELRHGNVQDYLNQSVDKVTEELIDFLVNAYVADVVDVTKATKYPPPQDDSDLW